MSQGACLGHIGLGAGKVRSLHVVSALVIRTGIESIQPS
jgi:hypothetical protein